MLATVKFRRPVDTPELTLTPEIRHVESLVLPGSDMAVPLAVVLEFMFEEAFIAVETLTRDLMGRKDTMFAQVYQDDRESRARGLMATLATAAEIETFLQIEDDAPRRNSVVNCTIRTAMVRTASSGPPKPLTHGAARSLELTVATAVPLTSGVRTTSVAFQTHAEQCARRVCGRLIDRAGGHRTEPRAIIPAPCHIRGYRSADRQPCPVRPGRRRQ